MRQAMLGMANSMGIKIKYREEYIEIISSRKEVGNQALVPGASSVFKRRHTLRGLSRCGVGNALRNEDKFSCIENRRGRRNKMGSFSPIFYSCPRTLFSWISPRCLRIAACRLCILHVSLRLFVRS